jgi:copper chaperone CopZ
VFRSLALGLLVVVSAPALACPMADAAAFASALEKVQASSGTHLSFTVEGMSCGDCSSMIARTLSLMPGVNAAAVDHQTGRAEIAYDGSKLKADMFVQAMQALGYKAALKQS